MGIKFVFLFVFAMGVSSFSFLTYERSQLKEKPQLVSTQCGEQLFLTPSQIREMSYFNHHKKTPSCPGFFALIEPFSEKDRHYLDHNCYEQFPKEFEPNVLNFSSVEESELTSLFEKVSSERIGKSMKYLSENFTSRFHKSSDANKASEWIRKQFQEAVREEISDRVIVELVEHQATNQKSVLAWIQPKEPSEEFVVLGGHMDSTAGWGSRWSPDQRAPGADDNASGTSVLIETFRVLMEGQVEPTKNIIFFAYAAEEVGLVGSQELAKIFKQEGRQVSGVIQFDMTSYLADEDKMKSIQFVTDFTSEELTSLMAEKAEKLLGLNVSYMKCGYACSDHASWTRQGFPAIMPVEAGIEQSKRRIHSKNDKVDGKISFEYAAQFAKLGVIFALSL